MKTLDNNIQIFQKGDSHNLPLIFVHGFPFDHQMWDKQIEHFSKNYFCITYDIRGLGISPVGDGQYTMESHVDDLFDVMEKLGVVKPVLCGLSMGGYIALRAVEREEEKFKGLILCDTKSEADNNETKLKRSAGIKKINLEGIQKYIAEFVPNCFAEKSFEKLGEEYIAILGRSMNSDPNGVKGNLLAMAGRTDTTDYLSKFKIPVLLLCGEYDKLTQADVMRGMKDKIENSEFFIVPEAGHMSPVENPQFVNDKLMDFLESINKS